MESGASDALAGGLVAVWTSMICLLYLIPMMLAAASIAVWIWVLVDVMQRVPEEFPNGRKGVQDPSERTMWLLIVLLAGVIGAAVYYVMIMKPYPRRPPADTPGPEARSS